MDSTERINKRVLCPMENVTSTLQSLDTVRALHQTVVSLRSALEEAKFEIQRLRSQISAQTDIKEGAKKRVNLKQIKDNEETQEKKEYESSEVDPQKTSQEEFSSCFIETENHSQHVHLSIPEIGEEFCSTTATTSPIPPPPSFSTHHLYHRHHKTSSRKILKSSSSKNFGDHRQRIVITPDISVTARRIYPSTSSSTTETSKTAGLPEKQQQLQDKYSKMGSKIDVKIKVMSNIKVDGGGSSSETTTSSGSQPGSARKEEDEQNEKVSGETENKRGEGFHLKTTSKDNINIQKDPSGKYVITQSSKENISLDDNDNSQSEGDNSVFMEEKPPPPPSSSQPPESLSSSVDLQSSSETKGLEKDSENKEEVDDIELIFSSEENRDPIQEDLVSISEYDPWQQPGNSGTPVLVKFSSLPSDRNSRTPTSAKKEAEMGKLSTSSTYDVFLEPDIPGVAQQKSIESMDSLDMQISMKSSSLEKDNSEDQKDETRPLDRDESLDFFNNEYPGMGGNRKWTNYNVLVETDISKCGIVEETTTFEMYRRNTCPNPPAYRSLALRDGVFNTRPIPSRISSKYSRRLQCGGGQGSPGQISRPIQHERGGGGGGPKRSSSAQTDITALPEHWKSESQLTGERCHLGGPCTLPSKFVPNTRTGTCSRHFSRISERSQEARRILLSDINFTSMVPELSRSADHLCQDENRQESGKQSPHYYKGNFLKTPDYAIKGLTPSVSMTSPGVSQWTVNESSFGTQTIQTGESWGKRGDSFDSCKSYSTGGSRYSGLDRHHRSRSVPSIRCAICKQSHHGIRASESMHYTPRVTFQEPGGRIRGSLPDLRYDCVCSRRFYTGRTMFTIHGDSSGSTESLLDEADAFVRKSMDSAILSDDVGTKRPNFRRMSENDIQKDYTPSKQSLPFLPRTAKCLKPGHLAKVISKNGRVVVGRVRYVGPLVGASSSVAATSTNKPSETKFDDLYVGVQLQSKCGDCDGTFEGRKFFECEPMQGLFVPFKKVVMAWTG